MKASFYYFIIFYIFKAETIGDESAAVDSFEKEYERRMEMENQR